MRAWPKNRIARGTHKVQCSRCNFDILYKDMKMDIRLNIPMCPDCVDEPSNQEIPSRLARIERTPVYIRKPQEDE